MVDWLLDPDNLIYVLNGGWILFLLIWSIILQTLERRASQGFVIDYCPGCGAMLSDDGRAWVGKDEPPKKRDIHLALTGVRPKRNGGGDGHDG